ncbi:hypothetical protein L9F63_021264 [Diploptera punctata]|uniref:Enoyl-[acyl-carrier-protein] reductase, mitochondrial n=1 Tax=Diploptera punctata TaxID=6984 RepID=A0AAD8EBJ1_DIPPU|nr:hypothetical protein L9F63_021264 [Diploptera punctata]
MAVYIKAVLELTLRNGRFSATFARTTCIRKESTKASKLVYSEYGEASKVVRQESESLRIQKDHEITVRMLAAPVNPSDINTIQGVYPIKPKLPSVPGNEGVGEVISVGNNVKNFTPGDRVIPRYNAWGTWRTHAVCEATEMMKVSQNIGIIEAATLSVNPCTAYRMLQDFVQLSSGDTIMQNGANSAAGQYVIQLCRVWGINSVNVVRNRDNIEELKCYLADLGATHVLIEEELRTTELFKAQGVQKPKLLLNCVGGKNAQDCLRHLFKGGVMVTYGGMSRQPVTIPTSAFIFKDINAHGFWITQWNKDHDRSPEQEEMLQDITCMYEADLLKPPIHKLVPFNNYQEALENTINPKGFSGVKYILDFQC